MYKTATMMMMVCESPLHAGTGSDLDFIDNPIQRERHTGHPKIESSSLKGALRERLAADNRDDPNLSVAFGPDNLKAGEERQGSLGFSDARLLLFPVKSMKGVFAWITCPAVLERFQADMRRIPQSAFSIASYTPPKADQAIVFGDALVITNGTNQKNVVLEEFAYNAIDQGANIKVGNVAINDWLARKLFPTDQDQRFAYWHNLLRSNLLIVPDTDFADFAELSTEVITRNKIDRQTGTVQNGHLFSEEYLPADSVLYSIVMAHPEFAPQQGKTANQVLDYFKEQIQTKHGNTFQAGGNASIGKGLLRTALL